MRKKQIAAFQEEGDISAEEAARAIEQKGDRSTVLTSFVAAAGAPERPERSSWGVQVLYVVYCFFCLIVLSSYTASLTSILFVQKKAVDVTGLQDLVSKKALLAVIPNGSNAAYFTNSQDPLARRLRDSVRFCDTDTCLRWLRQGVVDAFASDQPQLTYLASQQPCDLAVVGDSFGPGNLVFGLQKDSPLTPLFNDALQRFAEDGTLSLLRRAWFVGLSQCDAPDSKLGNSKLGVHQMLGAFALLAAGVVVAFAIGVVENLKWCLAKAYRRSCGDPSAKDGCLQPRVAGSTSRSLPPGFDSRWRTATFRLLGRVGRYAAGSPRTSAGGEQPAPAPLADAAAPADIVADVVASLQHTLSSVSPMLSPVSLSVGDGVPSSGGSAAAVGAAPEAAAAAAAPEAAAAGFEGFATKLGPDVADLLATVTLEADLACANVAVDLPSPMPREVVISSAPALPSLTLAEPHDVELPGTAEPPPAAAADVSGGADGSAGASSAVPTPSAADGPREEGAASVSRRSSQLNGASRMLSAQQSWIQAGAVGAAAAVAAAATDGSFSPVGGDGVAGAGGGGGDGGGKLPARV